MFKNSFQSGLMSIFYSCGSNPLAIWDMEVNNGHIKRLTDAEVNSLVLEIVSTNVATTYITCPRNNQQLGIKLPFLVMIVKNLKRYFSFEITVLDDKNMRRRFRISNFQSTTKIKPFCTTMPIGLSGGWNQIQFNLSDFTKRAYGSQYIEALRVQVHANVRIRRIYFAERLYTEEELPQEYKLYLPLEKKKKKEGKKGAAGEPAAVPTDAAPPTPVKSMAKVEIAPGAAEAPPSAEVKAAKSEVKAAKSEVKAVKSEVKEAEATAEETTEGTPSAVAITPAEEAEGTPAETPAENAEQTPAESAPETPAATGEATPVEAPPEEAAPPADEAPAEAEAPPAEPAAE